MLCWCFGEAYLQLRQRIKATVECFLHQALGGIQLNTQRRQARGVQRALQLALQNLKDGFGLLQLAAQVATLRKLYVEFKGQLVVCFPA